MANNLDSNITRKLLRAFIPAIEKQRVLSKTIDSQTFQGKWNPSSGDYIDIKRPHQYVSARTADGDISGGSRSPIISGKASALVQDYITVSVEYGEKEQSLDLDQLSQILEPAAEEVVTTLETSLGDYMIKNCGLATGVPDQPIDAWSDIAAQMSLLKSLGVPKGETYSVINPFVLQNLASAQTGLSADPSRLVQTAWELSQISSPFAGLKCISSNSLSTWTAATAADRAGALTATPTATYVSVKDTFQQTLAVTGFTAATVLKAGDILEFPGTGADARSYVHQKTHKVFFDGAGAPVPWRCTVVADVTLDGSGAGNVVVTGPAVFESGGAYDYISAALVDTDVVNVLGTSGKTYQPCLFYNKNAFSVSYVKLNKLYATDTVATSSDGLSIRCTKFSDGLKNLQTVRFDLLPAFATLNPFYAGKGFGYA